ncbi:MAG: apolipoprotein N-acyltransferase, partial [Deltaproteobacteria bacterium]|nr:apolipoprotein N-acyltransferase [Deltaproteobacteria bacterium]
MPRNLAKNISLVSLGGLALALTLPKAGLWPLAFFCLIPLWLAIQNQPPKKAFFLGWVYGLVLGLVSFSWLGEVMAGYGGLGSGGNIILIILAAYLALYQALWAWLMAPLSASLTSKTPPTTKFQRLRPYLVPLVGAGLWIGFDQIKNWVFTGFNWSPLAVGLALAPRLMGLADILGLYGLGFLVAAINGFLALFRPKNLKTYPYLIIATLIFSIIAIYGHFSFERWEKSYAAGQPQKVAILQASVDQDMKWDASYRDLILARFGLLYGRAIKEDPWLIVWSETAAPFAYAYDATETEWLNGLLAQSPAFSLVGVTYLDRFQKTPRLYNRAWLMGPKGPGPYYDKRHLVPFGEFVPMIDELPFLKWAFFQGVLGAAGAFSPGQPTEPMRFKGETLGLMICFESIFPGMARDRVLEGASLLVVTTNDGWFGTSWAPEQHLYQATWRAVENRRPLVRAANNGISALIAPSGRILERSIQNEVETYNYTLRLLRPENLEPTFFSLYGYWLTPLWAWLATLATLLYFAYNKGWLKAW